MSRRGYAINFNKITLVIRTAFKMDTLDLTMYLTARADNSRGTRLNAACRSVHFGESVLGREWTQ